MKKIKIYVAGPLFSEADVDARYNDSEILSNHEGMLAEKYGIELDVFNPIMQPINDKSTKPTAESIYKADEKALMESDYVLAYLDGEDAGVMYELGMITLTDKKVFAVASDIRLGGNEGYSGIYAPVGFNQFVVGALECRGSNIYNNKSDAITALIKDIIAEHGVENA